LKTYLPLLFILFALVEGCGVKAPPIPPDVVVPEPISDLQGRVREGDLYLRWSVPRENMDGSKPVDLVSFRILRRDEKGGCIDCPGEFKVRADLDLRRKDEYRQEQDIMSWKDKDLEQGILYIYKVRSINHWGYASPASNEVVIQWGLPPPPPSSLNGEGRDGAVMLSWEPAEGANGYNIYRRQKDEPLSLDPVNKTPEKKERYLDEGLQNEKKYLYVVRGVRFCGETDVEGKSSAEITAIPVDITPPSPPIGLIAISQDKGIELDWFPNEEPDLLGYSVYRQEIPGKDFHKISTEAVEESRFLDLSAERGKSYYFAVTAIDNSPRRNESSLSLSVKIKY